MTSGIIEILIENAGVQTAVGRNKDNTKWKVFPVVCPQDEEQPYITVYQSAVDTVSGKQCQGELDFPTVVVVGNSKNFRPLEMMMESVRVALDGMTSTTDAGYVFSQINLSEYREGYDEKAQLYVGIATYRIEQRIATTTT